MSSETDKEGINYKLVSLLLYMNVVNCGKKPFYHEPSKEVFYPGEDLPNDALFGYSITYQTKMERLIVGAPKANLKGEVYECERSNNTCSKINIELSGLDKTHFWLGASVSAGSDFFVTCAPRYCQEGVPDQKNMTDTTYMASQCFYQSADAKRSTKIRPLSSSKKRIIFYKYWAKPPPTESFFDTLGWSMDVSSDDITIVGGPGGKMGHASLIPKRKQEDQLLIQLHRSRTDPGLYELGYGVKAGKFLSSEVYAVSSPYGVMGQGEVLFFDKNRTLIQAVVDNEVGAIYGGALCNVKLGENGEEALLVGAPAHAPSRHDVDVGAVHVYVNEAGNMRWKRTISGDKNNGYFGYAIVSVGDLNLDNLDEVVISAPYENEYRGAVYIYSGADLMKNSSSDIQYLQRFEGDAPGHMLGLSLAALPDLDGNGCKELSIGVAGNNSAILMNCITYITFTLSFADVTSSIVENKDYRSLNKKACVDFTGNKILKRTIENRLTVEIKLKHPNATLVDSIDNILTYEVSLADLNLTDCRKLEIILPDNGNYDEIMVLQMTATLSGEDASNMTTFKSGLVMLTDDTRTHLEVPLEIADSGSILTMDLLTSLKGSNTKGYTYKIGSTQRETITYEVHNAPNSRSGAYSACVRVHIEGVGVARTSQNCAVTDDIVTCELNDGPILAGKSTKVNITLDTKTLTGEAESIAIKSTLDKICDDQNSNRSQRIDTLISLQRDYDIIVVKSTPSAPVNFSREEIAFGYENIRHVYSVRNSGVTGWGNVSCDVSVPEYVNVSITDPHGACKQLNNKNEATCEFKLASNGAKDVTVLMNVLPNTSFTEEVLKGKAAKLETEISCKVKNGDKVISRITTTMKLLQTSVPLYVLVTAAIVGLLLVCLLAYILYECGFLRRKHKEELMALKKDVRRQSIRRSMRLRESVMEDNGDFVKSINEEGDGESVVTPDATDRLHDRASTAAVIHSPAADVH